MLLVHLSALHHYRIIIQTKEDNGRSEPIYGVSILTFLFLNYFHTKRCYRYYTTMKNWQDALNFCKSETTNPSADLVSIPDKTTNDFLLNTMTNTQFWTEIWTGGYIQNGQWV